MRKKFRPMTAAALVRLEQLEQTGELFSLPYGEQYLTPVQAAYVIGCSTRTLANITADGRIKHDNFGKVTRYSRTHVMDFIGARASL